MDDKENDVEAGADKQDTDGGKVAQVAESMRSFISVITASEDAFLVSSSQTEDTTLLDIKDHL